MATRTSIPVMRMPFWDAASLLKKHDSESGSPRSSLKETRFLEVLVIPYDGHGPEIWEAESHIYEVDDSVYEEVDLRPFFPGGAISTLFCTIPSSGNPLPFAYRIFIDNHSTARPMNRAVGTMFMKPWIGNIVIVRYARSNSLYRRCFARIQRPEAELVVALVGDWLNKIWTETFGNREA